MYGNLIYFLLILLVFTTAQPGEGLAGSTWARLGLTVLSLVAYRFLAAHLSRRLQRGRLSAAAYNRLVTRLSILALCLYTAAVYFFGLKDLILALPLAENSPTVAGLLGVAAFAVFLAVMWAEAFPLYARLYSTRLTRWRFVRSQLRFNMPIILPWALISALADIVGLLPQSNLTEWLNSSTGEMVSFLVFLVVLVVFLPVLIRPLWGLKRLPDGQHRQTIEKFCRDHGFAYREIYLWPLYEGEGLTAGVMGLAARWRFILVTEALLRILDENELRAVLGHELGHVKRHHLAFYLFFFLGYLAATYSLFDINLWAVSLIPGAVDLMIAGRGRPSTALSLLVSAPAVLLMILYFRFIFGYFMRNFERQADLFAYRLSGTIAGLVGSLEKIAFYSGRTRNVPSWHHFSVAQRVDFLEQCQDNPALPARHDRKVALSLLVYVLVLAVIWTGGYAFKTGRIGRDVSLNLALRVVEAGAQRNPEDAQVRRMLGDVYYSADRLDLALEAYEAAAVLDPDDPEILNNLAWTLLTRPGSSMRDARRAAMLAEKAVGIAPEAAHIQDTMAEACFREGRYEQALEAIDRALVVAGPSDNRDYLRRQRAKILAVRSGSGG